jgi:uncharacterized protein YaaW (UPF0174 family)
MQMMSEILLANLEKMSHEEADEILKTVRNYQTEEIEFMII